MTKNYLDWLTNRPWGVYSKESFNLMKAETVLDEDHYGLQHVKEKILQFIAVGAMKNSVQGTLDELGTPLSQITFVVFDLETTGVSAGEHAITEIGAVKVRGGEVLGEFATLVDPGSPIPPFPRGKCPRSMEFWPSRRRCN